MREFDERRFERHLASNPDLVFARCWYWIRKLQARYLAGDYRPAIEAHRKAAAAAVDMRHHYLETRQRYRTSMTRSRGQHSAILRLLDERPQHLETLAAHHRQLEIWAENCPENFENRAALVGAEIARIEGRELDAERLYEHAIRSARDKRLCP